MTRYMAYRDRGALFCSDAFSGEVDSGSCEFKDDYGNTERLNILFCFFVNILRKSGFPWHAWIHGTALTMFLLLFEARLSSQSK